LSLFAAGDVVQCPPLNRTTLGQHKSDNKNQIIQLTDVFCVPLMYNGISNIWLQYAADSIIRDPIKRRALFIDLLKEIDDIIGCNQSMLPCQVCPTKGTNLLSYPWLLLHKNWRKYYLMGVLY